MGAFRVRDARGSDKEAIGSLWEELMAYHHALDPRIRLAPDAAAKYLRHVHEMIRSRNARVLVAESLDSGEVAAYLMGELQHRPPLSPPGLYGFISDIVVRADWRQQGVGRALFTEMQHWFVSRKATAIELYVAEANPLALAFWEEMGLEPFLKLMHVDL